MNAPVWREETPVGAREHLGPDPSSHERGTVMSTESVTALLNGDRPAGWLQYHDGSWAPVGYDGRVGPAITADDLLAVTCQDLDALKEPD